MLHFKEPISILAASASKDYLHQVTKKELDEKPLLETSNSGLWPSCELIF